MLKVSVQAQVTAKNNARIMGEEEDAARDVLCIPEEWSWKGRVFNRRH